MTLEEAVDMLDPQIDEHWTAEGLPRMDAIHAMMGTDSAKRGDVKRIAPGLTRDTAPLIEYVDDDELDAEEAAPAASIASAPIPATPPPAPESPPAPVQSTAPVSAAPVVSDIPAAPGGQEIQDVLDMPSATVLADPGLTIQAKAAIQSRVDDALIMKREVEEELAQLGKKSEILSRAEEQHRRANRLPEDSTQEAIAAYLRAMSETRARRVLRARKFIEGQTNARDVAREAQLRSPIDAALNTRRPGRGSARPVRPLQT